LYLCGLLLFLRAMSFLRMAAIFGCVGVVMAACNAEQGGLVNNDPDAQGAVRLDGSLPPQQDAAPRPTDAAPDVTSRMMRARCGADPYVWLDVPVLGDVLETLPRARYAKPALMLAVLKSIGDGKLKTQRRPQHPAKATVIRYQTQDKGVLVDATALVAQPDEAGTYPIMLLLHGAVGANDSCAPTRGIVDAQLGGVANETMQLASMFASFGYIVVFPDYLGMKSLGAPSKALHPYLVAEPTALASLDAVRAAKKLLRSSPVTPGELVVVGGSQGGHAAAFVSRYQPHYAPELPIKSSVWDVPPTDLVVHAERALKTLVPSSANISGLSPALTPGMCRMQRD
jgi:Secretory lipase